MKPLKLTFLPVFLIAVAFLSAACSGEAFNYTKVKVHKKTPLNPITSVAPPAIESISVAPLDGTDLASVNITWAFIYGPLVEIDVDRREEVGLLSLTGNSNVFISNQGAAWGEWTTMATLSPDSVSYSDNNQNCGRNYQYQICNVYNDNKKSCSLPVDVSGPMCPPKDLTATAVSIGEVRLDWMDNSDEEQWFDIYRKTAPSGPYEQIATVAADVTTYADTNVNSNTTYMYKVRGGNAERNSGFSNEATVTTPTECNDGIDNDGDGLIDWPADPGCTDLGDNHEGGHWAEIGPGSASGGGISNNSGYSGDPSLGACRRKKSLPTHKSVLSC
jgi:hypothetical protein